MRRLGQHRLALVSAGLFLLLTLNAQTPPLIETIEYQEQNLLLSASASPAQHWLATDTLGRDQFTRILYGSRISLMVGFVATAVALGIGVLWGATAGYLGGRVDNALMRIVDVLYALPFVIFIILLTVIFGSSLLLLFLAIGAVEWLTMARIVRGQVLTIKRQEFIEAAIAMGLSRWRIIGRHVIPNAVGPIIGATTLTMPSVI